MWKTPADANWESTAPYIDPSDHMPAGFFQPTEQDVIEAGFLPDILRTSQNEYCEKHLLALAPEQNA